MKEAKVVQPTKAIWGIEPKIGDEWDAGSVPSVVLIGAFA
jgi:hypothetical protein